VFARRFPFAPLVTSGALGLIALLALACEENHKEPERRREEAALAVLRMPARLRLSNESDVAFDSVEVGVQPAAILETDSSDFGALPAHTISEYLDVVNLYTYGYVRALDGTAEYMHFITDTTGEMPVPPGDYTYLLTMKSDVVPDPLATPPRHGWLLQQLVIDHILESSAPSGSER
jgi:hypothetical protein